MANGHGGARRNAGAKPKPKITKDASTGIAVRVLSEIDQSPRRVVQRWIDFLNGEPDRALRALIYLTDRAEGKALQRLDHATEKPLGINVFIHEVGKRAN